MDRARGQLGPLPRFSATHYGVECCFPSSNRMNSPLQAAVILRDTGYERVGLVGLSNDPIRDPSRKKYRFGYGFWRPYPGIPSL